MPFISTVKLPLIFNMIVLSHKIREKIIKQFDPGCSRPFTIGPRRINTLVDELQLRGRLIRTWEAAEILTAMTYEDGGRKANIERSLLNPVIPGLIAR